MWFTDAYIDGTEIWFSENDFNGLYLGNLETGEIKKVAEFPGEEKAIDLLYVEIQKVGSKLYFMPGSAEKIAVYDIDENIYLFFSSKKALLTGYSFNAEEDSPG